MFSERNVCLLLKQKSLEVICLKRNNTLSSTIPLVTLFMIIEQFIQFNSFNSFFFLFSFSDVIVRCPHNGYTYNVGETTPSQDGCNECTCRQNGNMECTNNVCSNGELLLLILSLPKEA